MFLFISFLLLRVFVAAHRLPPAAVSGGHSFIGVRRLPTAAASPAVELGL